MDEKLIDGNVSYDDVKIVEDTSADADGTCEKQLIDEFRHGT
jgi:hypothetical protein